MRTAVLAEGVCQVGTGYAKKIIALQTT